MKTHLKTLVTLFSILLATNQIIAQDATSAHKDSLEIVVKKYYDLNLIVFQANSMVEDIDKIFELFTEDFTYVHPKYGGTYIREDLYNGYIRNQKNGRYDGTAVDIEITNKIAGLNAVVVERAYIDKINNKIIKRDPQMTFFEFKKGKISRIFEYW
ncbi:nuclear transport factor 2 family protein [Flavobacteriaceae bacterium AU392]|nr:nuclear transport factor 2 family protein [Flavobacteriaceae bacterium]RKM85603.1 nuclear transport factor 2 family protein [Flavobacteriaceae bacterium AU392]